MQQIPIITSSCVLSVPQFWKALFVYHNKPHTVNRKIAGVVQVHYYEFQSAKVNHPADIFSYTGILYEVRKLSTITKETISDEFLRTFVEPYDKEFKIRKTDAEAIEKAPCGTFISIRILLSRTKAHKKCVEVVILDKNDNRVIFYAVAENSRDSLAPPFVYTIEHTKTGHLRICLDTIENCESTSANWLCEIVFLKLLKWAESNENSDEHVESLSLIDIGTYYELYHALKLKYYDRIINIWTERTDPKKFVHEDIAIAAYLICLWQKYSKQTKPSFVDLGCGNGLLVYILNQEGFPGLGIDVRKRKIWDAYPDHVILEVKTFVPSSASLFPNTDWIIGNHSDELTPWIPVIALRSSPKTNFFVLPCCAYDFGGQKYKRLNTSISQYSEYINYVKDISGLCRFEIKLDKLRIPSTKRNCIISSGRSYLPDEFHAVDSRLQEFIISRSYSDEKKATALKSDWVENFEPRSQIERVKNCTQLDKEFVRKIIGHVVLLLLDEQQYIEKSDGSRWNSGGSLVLADLPKFIPPEDLKQLKSECGGLKTLLKNHRYIFEVMQDHFKLRQPLRLTPETAKYKDKPCWFYKNHPDGCLYDSDICACKHM